MSGFGQPLPFSYGDPALSHYGMMSDTGPNDVESAICSEPTGLVAGTIVCMGYASPATNGWQESVTALKAPRTLRVADGTRKPVGFLLWNPGVVHDPLATTDVDYQGQCNVVRRGRIFVVCETAIADPTAITDLFYFRKGAGTGTQLGALRYGDNDSATCTQIPTGHMRAVTPCGAGGVGLFEFDFRNLVGWM